MRETCFSILETRLEIAKPAIESVPYIIFFLFSFLVVVFFSSACRQLIFFHIFGAFVIDITIKESAVLRTHTMCIPFERLPPPSDKWPEVGLVIIVCMALLS